jgi:hypothetical protein
MKYAGCHFDNTAAVTVLGRMESSLTTHAAAMPDARADTTNNDVIVGCRALPLGPTSRPSMQSERNRRLRTATRHAQQETAIADAANAQCVDRMRAGAAGSAASRWVCLRSRVEQVMVFDAKKSSSSCCCVELLPCGQALRRLYLCIVGPWGPQGTPTNSLLDCSK